LRNSRVGVPLVGVYAKEASSVGVGRGKLRSRGRCLIPCPIIGAVRLNVAAGPRNLPLESNNKNEIGPGQEDGRLRTMLRKDFRKHSAKTLDVKSCCLILDDLPKSP
jgi:hypothetical protein